jgi:hypothetical protein
MTLGYLINGYSGGMICLSDLGVHPITRARCGSFPIHRQVTAGTGISYSKTSQNLILTAMLHLEVTAQKKLEGMYHAHTHTSNPHMGTERLMWRRLGKYPAQQKCESTPLL